MRLEPRTFACSDIMLKCVTISAKSLSYYRVQTSSSIYLIMSSINSLVVIYTRYLFHINLFVLIIVGQQPKLCPTSFKVNDQCANINCFLEALKIYPASEMPQKCSCSSQGSGSLCSCSIVCQPPK